MVTADDGQPYFQRYLDRHWTQYKDAKLGDFTLNLTGRVPLGDDPPRGMYITGPVGTGKTHLLVALFREHCLVNPEADIAIINAPVMLEAIKAEFDTPASERRESFYYRHLGVLMLDDFDKGNRTPWVLEQFYTILNERYNNKRLTYFTSNAPLNEVERWPEYGEAIASRIRGMCNVLTLVGEDRRR